MEWEGMSVILLTEYFEDKVKEIEQKIVEFISALSPQQLKSIIYMSLDMDVKIGFPDKLAQ